ncbi:MAG: J domain-containing protein [Spirochaetota bacterium]
MDIFDRLGNLLRTILDDDDTMQGSAGGFRDPDEARAWEELETYMRSESTSAGERARGADDFARRPGPSMPESLKRDFRNLEVVIGAPLTEVRSSYKRLMAAFHPDRHSADPEKLRAATEITKKLNQSYQRIRTYYEGERASNQST